MPNYDEIDKALNIESSIVEVEKTSTDIQHKIEDNKSDDIKKDYEYTRANLYSLIEKGQEAINGIMELAGEGGSPRAYEVAGQLIKSVGDVTDKLIDLQKKLKDVEENIQTFYKNKDIIENNSKLLDQIGNTNIAALNVQGDSVTINSTTTGDNNTSTISCGTGGDCTGSTITNTITGDGNQVTTNSDGLIDSTVTITTNNNTVTINNTSTAVNGAKSNIDISGGGGNTVALTQAGAAGANGHDATIAIVGATNTVEVKQGGSNDSKVNATITGSGNNLSIKSNLQ